MTHELKILYGGADLCLKFDNIASASLLINGIERDSATSPDTNITLKLNSSVQTEYEWHEFVEAELNYSAELISASIHASNRELKKISIKRASSND